MNSQPKKVAVISGGTSGIGFAIAEALISEYDLALTYHSDSVRALEHQSLLRERGGRCEIFQCDISSDQSVADASKEILTAFGGNIFAIINNAGIVGKSNFFIGERGLDSHVKVMNVNYFGTLRFTQKFLASLYKSSSGSILNISSISSESAPGFTSYASSKAAIESFTKNLALEVAHRNISVNAIRPGMVETPMSKTTKDRLGGDELKKVNAPLGRFILPEEIARMAKAILSMGPAFTGQIVSIDGGGSNLRVRPSIY